MGNYPIIKKMAEELNLTAEQSDCIYATLMNQLLNKVPQLEQLIDSVFSDADPEKLSFEMDKVIILFQQQKMQFFVDWTMPEQAIRIQVGRDDIL